MYADFGPLVTLILILIPLAILGIYQACQCVYWLFTHINIVW